MKSLLKKKGMMGIETLIIFIAMIIVAAIAAGVLLRTQGLLQQRALAVGNEARERLVTGIEVISVVGNSNVSVLTINELEISVRLRAGSGDVQLKTVGVTATSRNFANNAVLQNEAISLYNSQNFTFLGNSNISTSFDYDYNAVERRPGVIRLIFGNDSPDNLSALEIYTTSTRKHIIFPIGVNFSDTNSTVDIEQEPIKQYGDGEYSAYYGFLTLQGTTNGSEFVDTVNGNWTEMKIETDVNNCDWSYLVPDNRYCVAPRLGNTNSIVEQGELLVIRYKLSTEFTLGTDMRVEWKFVPKGGAVEEIVFVTPQVISNAVTSLWP